MIESFKDKLIEKRHKRFTKDQVFQFLQEADPSNRYWLVRMVCVVLGYFGGNRVPEFRQLNFESVKEDPEGFWVHLTSITSCKERENK